MDILIGKTIDSYKILEVIGRGGMGVVYKAMDTGLDKIVALKMMDPNLAQDEAFLKRFRSEAKALAKLENPNIVNVYAFRETEYGLFIVMEYVDSVTLADKITKSGPIPWRKALPIFQQLLSGLGHAHQVGVLHRDIKPRNILITTDNTVKIMDFGLAKILQASDVTVTQTRAGTLYYMSPERVKGLSKIDHRSDLYSLGMTFYEILTGTVPFDKEAPDLKILETIVKGELPPPTQYNSDIPEDLSTIIMKSLEEDPANRFETAEKISEALDYFDTKNKLAGESGVTKQKVETTKKTVVSMPGVRKINHLRLIIAASIAVLFILLILFIPSWRNSMISIFTNDSTTVSDIKGNTEQDTSEIREITNIESEKVPEGESDLKLNSQASLTLQAIPEGSVLINGELRLASAARKSKLELKAGDYNIEFRHPQYGSKRLSLQLNAGQGKNLNCYFEQYINIQSLDESGEFLWSTVIIDGVDVGMETPISKYPLPVGSHKITVRRAGYKVIEGVLPLEITPLFKEKIIPLVFHLEKL